MWNFAEIKKHLDSFDFETVVKKAVLELESEIILLNKTQLFEDSEQSDGTKVHKINEPSMDSWYAMYTQKKHEGKSFTFNGSSKQKIAGDPYHLFETGQWFNSFKLIVEEQKETTFAVIGEKIDENGNVIDMEDNFGNEIYGLTQENKNIIIQKIQNEIQRKISAIFSNIPKI
jgi:hypothetical protein